MVRGQLSTDFDKPGRKDPLPEKAVHYLLTNLLCRPDFIAYDHLHKHNISRLACQLFKPLNVTWTIKSQAQMDACKKDFDLFIFEGFIPK